MTAPLDLALMRVSEWLYGEATKEAPRYEDIEALHIACEQLRRDAGRYRWLRSQAGADGTGWEVRQWHLRLQSDPRGGGQYLYCDGPRLDERIDAALARQEGK